MRDERRSYVITGGFALAMVALLLVWLALVSGRAGSADRYTTRLGNVQGLAEGSEVTLEGYGIGRVEEIAPAEEGGFEVTLAVRRGFAIPDDSVARIVAPGLLAAPVLDLRAGESPRPFQPGADIPGRSGGDLFGELSSLMVEVRGLMGESVAPLVEELARAAPQIVQNVEALSARLSGSADQLSAVLASADAGRVRSILDGLDAAARDAAQLARELRATAGRVDSLVERSAPSLEASAADVGRVTAAAARHVDPIAQDLEDAARHASEFGDRIRRDPSLLIRGSAEPEPEEGP